MEITHLIHESPFYQLAALLITAAIAGFAGLLLRQPLIVSFIAVGVLAGPSVLGLVHAQDHIELLAQLGISVLLFLVGLKLDLKLVKTLGAVSAIIGLGQVTLTALGGFAIAQLFGMSATESLYIGVALAFSSTIIIVKTLSDKREIDALHGRISLGVLIIQDLIVVMLMMFLSAVGASTGAMQEGNQTLHEVLRISLSGVAMMLFVLYFIRYVATPLLQQIARSQELLVCFAIAWAALLAAIGHYVGFSKELGGLLAGVSLASTPYREAIIARLSSLRDFLLLFFFVSLGSELAFDSISTHLPLAAALLAFVLLGKPAIVMLLMGRKGYRKRTGFLTGAMLGQLSEFSLILIALGLSVGHLSQDIVGLVTLVGMGSIALSVYIITYSHRIYGKLEGYLGVFERQESHQETNSAEQKMVKRDYDIILFGIGRFGEAIAREVLAEGKRLLAVDFNPESVRSWQNRGLDAVFGDASDPEFIGHLPLHQAKWIISAMPQHETGVTHEDPRFTLIHCLRNQGYKGHIAVTSHNLDEIELLESKGADCVLLPFQDAATQAVNKIIKAA